MLTQRDRLATSLAGRYDNLRELGAGGMAVVYLGRTRRCIQRARVLRDVVRAVLSRVRVRAL